MINYNNLFNLISLILVLMILFIILYGCQYRIPKNVERFENKEEEKKESEDSSLVKLSSFEKSILEGLTSGLINTDALSEMIKTQKFTPTNLENLINYVETFKGSYNN
jgi:hypothetical protein